jgi:hypothetical protein
MTVKYAYRICLSKLEPRLALYADFQSVLDCVRCGSLRRSKGNVGLAGLFFRSFRTFAFTTMRFTISVSAMTEVF